ncbi:hypothetical protein ABZ321_57735, partial [Dactylosporangium sp. NPDC006015]
MRPFRPAAGQPIAKLGVQQVTVDPRFEQRPDVPQAARFQPPPMPEPPRVQPPADVDPRRDVPQAPRVQPPADMDQRYDVPRPPRSQPPADVDPRRDAPRAPRFQPPPPAAPDLDPRYEQHHDLPQPQRYQPPAAPNGGGIWPEQTRMDPRRRAPARPNPPRPLSDDEIEYWQESSMPVEATATVEKPRTPDQSERLAGAYSPHTAAQAAAGLVRVDSRRRPNLVSGPPSSHRCLE